DLTEAEDPLAGKVFSEARLAWREEYIGEPWTIRTADGLTLVAEHTRPAGSVPPSAGERSNGDGLSENGDLPGEDGLFEGDDGEEYYIETISPEDSHAWVILASGIRGRELYLEDLVIELHRRGVHVLKVHLRGHGPSGGDSLGLGFLDRADVLSWVRRVETADPLARIVLFGFSDAAAAMLMAAPDVPPSVVGIVSDSAFTRYDRVLSRLLREQYELPVFPLMPAGNLACYRRQGFWFSDADPETAVANARVPILFFHGGADGYIPPEMAEALFEAAPGNPSLDGSAAHEKSLLIVPNASHCRAMDAAPETYWKLLGQFLELRLTDR
ncbi:MAG: alpha/beta hydrolase, partial [Oscillospiraceae bacterium]|nr:alpha/beta hydrolase [Oscillospiraceae bacterium]